MERYFFHRIDGGFEPDLDGTECQDLHSARLEAILYAAGTVRDHPEYIWAGDEMRVTVSDKDKRLRFTVIIKAIEGD